MKFSYNWIKEYVDAKVTPQKAGELLTMHSFEVEEVIKDGTDNILDIDILPNRMPDAASHVGVARELATILNKKLKAPEIVIKEDKKLLASSMAKVVVKDTAACPRYGARVISGVKVGPSSKKIQDRLKAVGLNPINNVVDAANYVMLELGQPLHVFDLEKIAGKTIIVRRAKADEQIEALDGESYKLNANDLVIADKKSALAIAGIKGGASSGVTDGTTDILLEAANFDLVTIRRTSKKLRLITDASKRFSAGLSPHLVTEAINRLAQLIVESAGGRVFKGVIDVHGRMPTQHSVAFSIKDLSQFLGVKVKKEDVVRILEQLNFSVKVSAGKITVKTPILREDIEQKEDVFEEVGRIFGYENISSEPLLTALKPLQLNEKRTFRKKTREALSHLGFYEIRNYIFTGQSDYALESVQVKERWELKNPISSDRESLKTSLVSGVIKSIGENQRFKDNFGVFEIGKTFLNKGGVPVEGWSLVMGMVEKNPKNAHDTFYSLKGRAETFLEKAGIIGIWFDEVVDKKDIPKGFSPAKSAVVNTQNNKPLGFVGELDEEVLRDYNIDGRAVVAMFNLDFLESVSLGDKFYQEIPKFPPLKRDIAFLVPNDVRIVDIENVIYGSSAKDLVDVDLFDIYEDIREGDQKSVAFHLIFQSDKKTLLKKDVEEQEAKIKKELEEKLGATIR